MLLALWADFWNVADWGLAPPPTPTPAPEPGSGGGWRNYERANSDYWDEREKALQKFAPVKVVQHVVERFPEVEALVEKRNAIVARAPNMPDLQSLAKMHEVVAQLDLQIEKYRVKCDEEALLALLL